MTAHAKSVASPSIASVAAKGADARSASTLAPAKRGDFGTYKDASTLVMQRSLPGPIERVWSYLTDSALRGQWLASGDMEMKPGTSFELVWRNDRFADADDERPEGMGEEYRAVCQMLEVDPPRKLRYLWPDAGEVTIELAPQGDKVLLTLTHRRVTDRRLVLSVSAGWHTHLDILAARLEGTQPPSLWREWVALRDAYDRRAPR